MDAIDAILKYTIVIGGVFAIIAIAMFYGLWLFGVRRGNRDSRIQMPPCHPWLGLLIAVCGLRCILFELPSVYIDLAMLTLALFVAGKSIIEWRRRMKSNLD